MLLAVIAPVLLLQRATAQGNAPDGDLSLPPAQWAAAAAHTQEAILRAGLEPPLQYRVRKVDAHGEVSRAVIESKDGPVARLIERDGMPLTQAENADERQRLQTILDQPAAYLSHVEHEQSPKVYAMELLDAMPHAMLWRYAPGQPRLPGAPADAVVLDFEPDPTFRPPTLVTEGLIGIAGRVWVDRRSHGVLQIQGHILRPVNFGWGGVLARVNAGGTLLFAQAQTSTGRWLYTHAAEHLTVREVVVRTVQQNTETWVTEITPEPASLSLAEAVHQLLRLPVSTR